MYKVRLLEDRMYGKAGDVMIMSNYHTDHLIRNGKAVIIRYLGNGSGMTDAPDIIRQRIKNLKNLIKMYQVRLKDYEELFEEVMR